MPSAHASSPLGATVRKAREDAGYSVREIARRAGISHTQISRLEAGTVAKPSREILVALSRALDRNPLPVLILAGHASESDVRAMLSAFFREGSELAEIWEGCSEIPLSRVRKLASARTIDWDGVRRVAVDAYQVQAADETFWDDSYELAVARGEDAEALREVTAIWRYLDRDLRRRWLDYGRTLREIADLDYLAAEAVERSREARA